MGDGLRPYWLSLPAEARVSGLLSFTVPGIPRPKLRGRAFLPKGASRPRVYNPAENVNAEAWIRQNFLQVADAAPIPLPHAGPVRLIMYFAWPPPRNCWAGKERTTRPDLDQVIKVVLDSLNGLAYRDDCQVVACYAEKVWDARPHTLIVVEFYEDLLKPRKEKARVR